MEIYITLLKSKRTFIFSKERQKIYCSKTEYVKICQVSFFIDTIERLRLDKGLGSYEIEIWFRFFVKKLKNCLRRAP